MCFHASHVNNDVDLSCITAYNSWTGFHLSSIGKVSKLCLPQHQAVGVLHAVPQLKAQDPKLGQAAVADGELVRLLPFKDMCQREVALTSFLVMHYRMPVTKGASLYVLSTHAYMVACRPNTAGGHIQNK